MVIDDRTTNFNLALVNENNELQDDVFRLREATEDIDGLLFGLTTNIGRFMGTIVPNCSLVTEPGFYAATDLTTNGPSGYTVLDGDGLIHIKKLADGVDAATQIYLSVSGRMWMRHKAGTNWGAYVEFWTAGNLVKQTSPTDVTTGSMLQVGSFGIGSGSIDAGTANANSLQLGGFFRYETSELAATTLNLPTLGGVGGSPRHWHVITQGSDTLKTQIATEVKGVGTTKGRIFTRVFETDWSAWSELAPLSSVVASNQASAERIDEVEIYALAGL